MPISTEPSTFEFACSWLVSSETFCRDAMGATAVDLDTMRQQALARIHDEEAFEEADDEDENETAPDVPPPLDDRPRTIIRTQDNERKRVGTGTWAGRGTLLVGIEVIVPADLRPSVDDDMAARVAKFKARKTWARQLWRTIKSELRATSGQGDGQGNPYLNATDVNGLPPAEPEVLEGGDNANWMGWTFEVPWRG